jgi:hypothetical protein
VPCHLHSRGCPAKGLSDKISKVCAPTFSNPGLYISSFFTSFFFFLGSGGVDHRVLRCFCFGLILGGLIGLFFFSWQDWGLNSGLHICKAPTLPLEPHL